MLKSTFTRAVGLAALNLGLVCGAFADTASDPNVVTDFDRGVQPTVSIGQP